MPATDSSTSATQPKSLARQIFCFCVQLDRKQLTLPIFYYMAGSAMEARKVRHLYPCFTLAESPVNGTF
jgi:hypothetical protein